LPSQSRKPKAALRGVHPLLWLTPRQALDPAASVALALAICRVSSRQRAFSRLVLGPMMEEYLRRALLISLGDTIVLVTSPISLGFLLAAAGLLVSIVVPLIRSKREEALKK
jgi:TctA family transporter